MASLEDLISALDSGKGRPNLPNTKETWNRIRAGEDFDELGLNTTDLKNFLEKWIEDNDYNNLADEQK